MRVIINRATRKIIQSGRNRNIWRSKRYTKFIVLSRSRTGSNLLLSYLNSHPQIFAEGEIFKHVAKIDLPGKLNRVYGKYPFWINAVGFKIFYYHPLDDTSGKVWEYLLSYKDLRVIHLTRDNILRTILSRKIAEKTSQWKLTETHQNGNLDKRVIITKDELIDQISETTSYQIKFENLLSDHQLFKASYEELIGNLEDVFCNILDFLDVQQLSRKPATNLRRQNPEKLSDLILNYEELNREMINSEFSKFFDQ